MTNKEIFEQPKQGMTEAEFEKAKAGAEIETNEGESVRVLCFDANLAGHHHSIVFIREKNGDDFLASTDKTCFLRDFRLRTTKREGWVALRKGEYGMCVNGAIIEEEDVFDSIWGDKDFIKAHVTWEE